MPKVKSEPATITSTVTSIFTSILLQGTLPYPVVRPSRLSSAPAEAKEGLLPSGQDARDEVEVKPARSQRTTEKKTASDKLLLVHLVLKSSNPDWTVIAQTVGKSPVLRFSPRTLTTRMQRHLAKDPPPCAHRQSTMVRRWATLDRWEKVRAMGLVLESVNPDWKDIATCFPGKTPNQVKDIWRKAVAPRLRKGMTIG